jgi:hypothetical protein
MHANCWELFEEICTRHGLSHDVSEPLNRTVRYAKPGLVVRSTDCEEFWVTHGETSQRFRNLPALSIRLREIDPV